MTRTTYYLAGPMSGYPEYNFPAFEKAADVLRKRRVNGYAIYDVLSPVDITRALWKERYNREFNPMKDKAEWGDPIVAEMLKRDLAAVFEADGIVLLPGWEQSKGANIELAVAKQVGKMILTYNPATQQIKVVAPNDVTPKRTELPVAAAPVAPASGDFKVSTANKKVPLDYLPLSALGGAARVFQYGDTKYARGNFLNATLADGAEARYTGGIMRHLGSCQGLDGILDYSRIDEESGLPEIDHMLAGLIMLRAVLIKENKLPADPGKGNNVP